MRRLICALALSLIAIAPAAAQDQSAAARQMITAAGADGVFDVATGDNVVAVRHQRSGLVCRLDPAFANRIVLYPQAARGEDVSCDSHSTDVFLTLYATRYGFETTLTEQIAGASDAIRQRYPDARPLPDSGEVNVAGVPSRSAHFLITRNGVQMYTHASVAQIGQWVIKLRYSAPVPDAAAAAQAEQTAAALWRATLQEIVAEHS